MKTKVVITLVYVTVLLGCSKEKFDKGFSGITSTDESGVILSGDLDDWNFDDEWSQTEQGLFSESYNKMCTFENISDDMSRPNSVIAYPNPCCDYFSVDVHINGDARIVYRIVDSKYNILASGEVINSDFKVAVSSLGIENKVVRIYYKIFGDNCELRGHGDLKIE